MPLLGETAAAFVGGTEAQIEGHDVSFAALDDEFDLRASSASSSMVLRTRQRRPTSA